MNLKQYVYKELNYSYYPDIDTIETTDFGVGDLNDPDSILKAALFAELVGHKKPKNIIINRQYESAIMSFSFIKFLNTYIFQDTRDYGVKNLYFILSPKEYELALSDNKKPSYVHIMKNREETMESIKNKMSVEIIYNPEGSLKIKGEFRLLDNKGNEMPHESGYVKICRCGLSKIQPFCDHSHRTLYNKPTS